MRNRLWCSREWQRQANKLRAPKFAIWAVVCILGLGGTATASDEAPAWMHAMVGAPLPSYDEKTEAVLLYSETNVTVVSADKVKTHVREVYKILRPEGRKRGTVLVFYRPSAEKVTSIRAWCIPAQGKDFSVKEKDAIDLAPPGISGGELIDDLKARSLRIPAADPGNVIGYEYEVEEQPLLLQESWHFQEIDPAIESHYSLQLPPGWEFKAFWLNYAEVKPSEVGATQWQWTVRDIKGIRPEPEMPPVAGVEGRMILSFFPSGGSLVNGFSSWQGMGIWYSNLVGNRVDASDAIKQEVATLTANKPTQLQKMQALAEFVQQDIRYVAIELGIGGWQPHAAPDVFVHRYGDCKDKATLMRSLLRQIGIDSYHVVINTERGSVTPNTPAHNGFNHAITAIKLPDGLNDPSLLAVVQDAKLGRILFFDPTDELTPFGQIRGPLQANYGLLVTPDGGELVELPQEPSAMNSIQRTGKLRLDASGNLSGEVNELRFGDRAATERWRLRTVTSDADRIKPVETLLAGSLSNFQITQASVINLKLAQQPFGFRYSFESDNYAKNTGGLLLVRARVLGEKSEGILETKEPRKFPIEFPGPVRDTDIFEITIPTGYEVDDLPSPTDAEYSFASYHSKTETHENVIRYTRTFEVKELSVPAERAGDLRKFYGTIAGDERSTVVLKPVSK